MLYGTENIAMQPVRHFFRYVPGLAGPLLVPLIYALSGLRSDPVLNDRIAVGKSSRSEFVGYGEVTALQKRKGVLRVSARPPKLQRLSPYDLREFFLKKSPKLLLLDPQNRLIGSFQSYRVQMIPQASDSGESPRQVSLRHYQVLLYGSFELSSAYPNGVIQIGFRAGLFRPVAGYLAGSRGSLVEHGRAPLRTIRHHRDRKEMVYIPEDIVFFGQSTNPYLDNYNPRFRDRSMKTVVRIRAFYIDRYEVTNQEYLRFCRETGHPLPPSWKIRGSYEPGRQNHPIIEASYKDAEAYARWAGKRLPTELEWELAARGGYHSLIRNGTDYREVRRDPPIYPIGNEFDPDLCNTAETGLGDTLPIERLHDRNLYGLYGMCGNAREWTSSWYRPYPGNPMKDARGVFGTMYKVIRGGSFATSKQNARADFRDYGGFPTLTKDKSAGFRLVISAK